MLTNNVIIQECGVKTDKPDTKPSDDPIISHSDNNKPSDITQNSIPPAQDDGDIWRPSFIALLIIIGIIVGICIYEFIIWFINRKKLTDDDKINSLDE